MEGTMKVAVMQGAGRMGFERRPIPQPEKNEVLVKIEYVGICGSDLHIYEQGNVAGYETKFPFVLGHESGGTVVKVGENVTSLKEGDRVALEPGKTCGRCEFCKSGRYNLCPEVSFFAAPPVDGVFQEYAVHPADLCFKLPDNVSTLEGALIEPLAVGFHAANQGGAHVGQTAVVMGAGCIGLVSMMALLASGVSRICIVDVMDNRLKKAVELGADFTVNASKENVTDAISRWTDGKGVDLVIETAGNEKTMQQAVEILKKGATLVFVGYSKKDFVSLPVNDMLNKELNMKTVFRYRNIYPMAIEAVAAGKVNLKNMITNIFPLDDIQNAMDLSVRDKANIVKAVVKVAED